MSFSHATRVGALLALLLPLWPASAGAQSVAGELTTLIDAQIEDTAAVMDLFVLIEDLKHELDAYDGIVAEYRREMQRLMLSYETTLDELRSHVEALSLVRVETEQRILNIHFAFKERFTPGQWAAVADVEARGIGRLTDMYALVGHAGSLTVDQYIRYINPALKSNLQQSARYQPVRRALAKIEQEIADHNLRVLEATAEIATVNRDYGTTRETFEAILSRLDIERSAAMNRILEQRRIVGRIVFRDQWARIFKPIR